MALCAFVYEWSADQVVKKAFRELTEEEKKELGFSDEMSEEVKAYDPEKAGKYIFAMYITYYPSFPIRKLVSIFK